MAGRRHKIGLDYFELDCFLGDKIKLIQAEYGLKGFAIVVKLYQKIYGEDGYYCEWNDDTLLLFMSENGLSGESGKNLVNGVISCCIRRGIFSEEIYSRYGILTSAGVQSRYLNATSKREKVELKKEYLLLSEPNFNKNVVINSISDGINAINVDENAQSREEKSREEKSRVCSADAHTPTHTSISYEDLVAKYDKDFVDERIERSKRYSGATIATVAKWCKEDWENRKNVPQKGRSMNTFNDFPQRTYDYDALEKSILANGEQKEG